MVRMAAMRQCIAWCVCVCVCHKRLCFYVCTITAGEHEGEEDDNPALMPHLAGGKWSLSDRNYLNQRHAKVTHTHTHTHTSATQGVPSHACTYIYAYTETDRQTHTHTQWESSAGTPWEEAHRHTHTHA